MPKSLIPITAPDNDPATEPPAPGLPSEPIPATPVLALEQLDTAQPLAEIFQPFKGALQKWQEKVASLIVTDLSQKNEMALARSARLELRQARISLDKRRLSLVEHLKARSGKIDATARLIREEMEKLEDTLLQSEQFAERHAAKLKAETKLLREQELAPFMDTPIIGDLSDLSVADYANVLSNAKLLRAAKQEAAVKAKQEADAKAKAEQAERERIAAENLRLKEEAEQARQARQAKEAADAAAQAERERVEAEREAERVEAARAAAAEIKRVADIAEAERKRVEAALAEERRQAEQERQKAEAVHAEERRKHEADHRAAMAEAVKAREELRKMEQESEEAEAAEKRKAEAERKAKEKAERAAAAAPDRDKMKLYAIALSAVPRPKLSVDALNRLDRIMMALNRSLLTMLDEDHSLL